MNDWMYRRGDIVKLIWDISEYVSGAERALDDELVVVSLKGEDQGIVCSYVLAKVDTGEVLEWEDGTPIPFIDADLIPVKTKRRVEERG